MQIVDELDESSKTWGAVNTVRFEARDAGGNWQPLHHFPESISGEIRTQGFNTDSDGIARSLREDLGLKLAGLKVLLVGTGGAGQVAALRLAMEGVAELFVTDYVVAKAEAVAEEIRKRYPRVKVTVGFPKGEMDLLLNATPIGLKPGDPSPLDEKQFSLRQARAVYDMIYKPAETKLLATAKAAGCKTSNGLGMLLHQGAAAFEIWTGQTAPIDVMRRALEQNVYQSTVHSSQSALRSPQSRVHSRRS
jgi:shikimate dehydrogenase